MYSKPCYVVPHPNLELDTLAGADQVTLRTQQAGEGPGASELRESVEFHTMGLIQKGLKTKTGLC